MTPDDGCMRADECAKVAAAPADAFAVTDVDTVQCGDCLDRLAALPDACIDLIYLDPPFNTRRCRQATAGRFPDTWPSVRDYIDWMRPRVAAVHRVLRPSGSILLHCDWRTVHHLRLLLDDLFGEAMFVNHLIWQYGLGGSSPRRFARKHDDILFYGRTEGYYFEPPRIEATSRRMRGQMKKATDVIDIPALNNMAVERVGYPTQKPLALLTMLIEACCPGDGVVLDPFCGSGTTLVAARLLGRGCVGIDISEAAVALARQRLAEQNAPNRTVPTPP